MGFNMNVTGISEKITILETFDKDVAKTLKKEMRAGARRIDEKGVADEERRSFGHGVLTRSAGWRRALRAPPCVRRRPSRPVRG